MASRCFKIKSLVNPSFFPFVIAFSSTSFHLLVCRIVMLFSFLYNPIFSATFILLPSKVSISSSLDFSLLSFSSFFLLFFFFLFFFSFCCFSFFFFFFFSFIFFFFLLLSSFSPSLLFFHRLFG